MKKIAVLGGPYSYTDLATPKGYEKVYFSMIPEIFEAVEKGETPYGIVPLENLLKGHVKATLAGLATCNVEVIREIELPIEHCLVRKKGEKNKPIKNIISHPQALAQCKKYIDAQYPEAERTEAGSTRAAMDALGSAEEGIAAIGSKKAAQLLGFDIEKEGIGDQKVNRTLFMLIKSKSR